MIINGAGRPAALSSTPGLTAADASVLGADREQALGTREHDFLLFGSQATAFARDLFRSGIADDLRAYLEQGFLHDADASGPVQRKVAPGDGDDGLDACGGNLTLRDGVLIFGRYNNHGNGDCYYACVPGRGAPAFFSICIESGVDSGEAYEISVSPSMDWPQFLAHLPPA
ncbi:hypothetical protein ABIA68_000924 [Stenotrophomonas rhizophila]|uniref:hypothetical protein n=1 Tax=Stenotrophomonas rhizophila TaxID=216778 RepID=UPI00339B5804